MVRTIGNPYTEKLDAEQYQKLLALHQPLVFVFSDNDSIVAQFKEYAFSKLNVSTSSEDAANFAAAGTEQEDVAQFIRKETQKNDVLAACQLVRETDECVVVPYDSAKPLDEQIQRILSRLGIKVKYRNAVEAVVD